MEKPTVTSQPVCDLCFPNDNPVIRMESLCDYHRMQYDEAMAASDEAYEEMA